MKYVLAILSCMGLSFCHSSEVPPAKHETRTLSENKPTSRESVALEFLNAYVENCNRMQSAREVMEWVQSHHYTTKQFNLALKRLIDDAVLLEPEIGLEADPIFNAQDYPSKGFELVGLPSDSTYITLRGINWPDFVLQVYMVNQQGQWLVEGCGSVNAPPYTPHTN